MKTTKKILQMAMAIMVTAVIFNGCQKDGGGTPQSGLFDGKISATIDNSSEVPSIVTRVVAWNNLGSDGGYLTGNQLADAVAYSGGSFTVTLPNPLPSGMRSVTVKQLFEDILEIEGKPKYSDPNVRLFDVDFLAFNTGFTQLPGYFVQVSSDKKMECWYVYADGDVTVTGGSNLSVSFGQGWNRLYLSQKLITTKAQSGMKWYFSDEF